MKKTTALTAAVLVASAIFLAFGLAADEADASYASTFGSDSVGAERIVFDSNGGSGGYAQYVLNGNSVYFPTEYKAPGTSNSTYAQLAREGYVLLGWSEDRNAASPSYWPGQSYTVTVPKTFYAVWKDLTYGCIGRFGGQSESHDSEAQHATVQVGSDPGLTVNDETGAFILMRESVSRGTLRYILTVTGNGAAVSSTANGTGTSVSADWLTMNISNRGEFSFSGTPNRSGIFEITVNMQTKGIGNNWGDLEDLYCRWYVSAYDANDPSNICHVTYNGNDCGYGPFHSAVKLPDSVTTKQKGWNVTVNGSPAIFPVGGSYTLDRKETILTVNEYTYDEVAASGVVGVIAYNANGGFYNGSFAELVPSDGYAGLKNGSIVSKEGCTFLGWNASGLSTDPICPAGYLYDIRGEYTELKAVWGSPSSVAKLYFENPGDGSQNISFDAYAGFRYALPVNGFALSGYDLAGWSTTRYDVGTGTADAGNSVMVTSAETYYAVFEPKVYSCTLRYDGNGGTGVMGAQTETVSSVPHYMTVAGCAFAYAGHSFAGWSEARYADSPSYLPGSSYCFADSGDVTLYAVWSENIQSEYNTFHLLFSGNGPNVTNIPPQAYRITSEREIAVYVPSMVPQRDDCRFVGWSDTAYGAVIYSPGQKIVMTLGEGQSNLTLTLFAVWEPKTNGGDGTTVTVTFVADSGTLRTVQIPSGNAVTVISAPSVEGRAFLGWFNQTEKWNFSSPVTGDLTLTAKYLPIFHLEIEGTAVKVVLDCTSSSATVSFSDGFSHVYESSSIPAHTVANNTSGSVTVSVITESGPYSAVCHYVVSDNPINGSDTEEERQTFEIGIVGYATGGIIGLLALCFFARRFVL